MRKQPKNNKRKWYIPIATAIIVAVLGFQLINLYSKLSGYKAQEAELAEELEEAKTTEQELVEYEEYTKSDEFIKNTARSKLGLVGENEIIFKEK